jgi:hypothetical protein
MKEILYKEGEYEFFDILSIVSIIAICFAFIILTLRLDFDGENKNFNYEIEIEKCNGKIYRQKVVCARLRYYGRDRELHQDGIGSVYNVCDYRIISKKEVK